MREFRRTAAGDRRLLYVINLCASTTPMALAMPEGQGLEGLAVFRSRRIEDGRHRYRLHLGYFESRADAEHVLPIAKRHYPTAWIARAPSDGLGSLDDTDVSEFRLIRAPVPASGRGQTPQRPAASRTAQRYVVQLTWSTQRSDPQEIAQLAIFAAFTLYNVTMLREGVRLYGIRLGFFKDPVSARQVALYVRSDFPQVAVVPISEREHERARQFVQAQRPSAAVPSAATEADEAQLAAPPASAAVDQPDTGTAGTAAPAEPLGNQVVRESQIRWRTRTFTREDLLSALGADDLSLRSTKRDPHEDPGMNYPLIPPGKRKSPLARLLTRLADRLG